MVKQAPCMHPWSYAYINHAGGVGFCDHLIGEPGHMFASVQDRSFDEIWNGPDFVELRRYPGSTRRRLVGGLGFCVWGR